MDRRIQRSRRDLGPRYRVLWGAAIRFGWFSAAENRNGFTTASDLKLLEDAVHMVLDGRESNRQALSNFFIREAFVEHLDDLGFP